LIVFAAVRNDRPRNGRCFYTVERDYRINTDTSCRSLDGPTDKDQDASAGEAYNQNSRAVSAADSLPIRRIKFPIGTSIAQRAERAIV
jgi:hypothetical protein